MSSPVSIVTHFSAPKWPMVNKLSAICKCLGVCMTHCSTVEKLRKTIRKPHAGRVLLFTDEGLLPEIVEFESLKTTTKLEVAMFILSPIAAVAQKMGDLSIVKYLIGLEDPNAFGRDLSILIKKFSDGDILDLDKYLAFGSKINRRKVNSSKSKREAIDSVSSYISTLGDPGYNHPFNEYARRVAILVDELLLNAVFNANPRLRNANRNEPFELDPHEEIQISWGYDGEYFGVSVRDPFGMFLPETIMEYISSKNKVSEIVKSPSAGLGLKIIFEKTHQLVTNVRKEQVTEVIALMRFASRLLEFENQKKSFYFFADTNKKGAGNAN